MANLDLQQLERLFFLLLGLILLLFGALVVYVVAAGRRRRAKAAQVQRPITPVPRPASQVTGQVLSLVREGVGGALQVEVDGLRYHRLVDIEDPEVRRHVVDAALALIQFTGVLGQDVIAPASLEETHRWREDLREDSKAELERIRFAPTGKGSQPQVSEAPDGVEEQFLGLLAEMGQSPPPRERPGTGGSIQQRWTAKPAESGQPYTFVDDIEEIVQRRVQLIPALIGRDLHVRVGSQGVVCFAFEGREYESLDELPNMTAQQLIRDSIREWDETT